MSSNSSLPKHIYVYRCMWFETNNKRKPYLIQHFTNPDDVNPLIDNAEADNKVLKVVYMKSYVVDKEYKDAYETDLKKRLEDLNVDDDVKERIVKEILVEFK